MTKFNSTKLLIIGLIAVVLSLGGALTNAQDQGKVLRIAVGIDPDHLDPIHITTTLPGNIVDFVCDTLVYMNPEGELEPELATEWSSSANGLEWTFKLRKGVTFQDGTPFNAKAVKFNFDRIMDPDLTVEQRSNIGPLDHTEVIDEYTVKFVLSEPYGPFLQALTTSPAQILSPAAVQKYGEKIDDHPVGTGPYKFDSWTKGESIVIVRNDGYWGELHKISKVEFLIVPEPGTREMMLLAGDVDAGYQLPAPDVPALEENPDINLMSKPTTRMMYVYLHTQDGPTANKKVRQAMNYAVNKKAIIDKLLLGQGEPLDAPIPKGIFGYHRAGYYEYNPSKAKKLLAEAGYSDGFEIKFLHPTGRYMLDAQVAEAIQANLGEVGITVKLETMDWPSVIQKIVSPDFEINPDMEMLGWGVSVPDANMVLYNLFHTKQQPPNIANTGFYENSKVDSLLAEARTEADPQKRKELYKEAIEIIWDDAPMIFLYVQNLVFGTRDYVKGIVLRPDEEFEIKNADIVKD